MLKSLYAIIILALAVLPCAAQEAMVDSMAVDSAFSASNAEFPVKKAVWLHRQRNAHTGTTASANFW